MRLLREQLGDNTEQMEYPEEEKQSQPLRRSEGQRVESTKYPSSEYVLINDEGEPGLKDILSHHEKSQMDESHARRDGISIEK